MVNSGESITEEKRQKNRERSRFKRGFLTKNMYHEDDVAIDFFMDCLIDRIKL